MIDAHFHIWQLARGDYGWLTPESGAIYRDVNLVDWRRASRPSGVSAGILVQAAPTELETGFLLEQADTADDVLGVVGWLDMLADNAADRVHSLARQPKLKALRPMLQDLPDARWILQEGLDAALQAMVEAGLAFDALVKPVHLPHVATLAQRYPGLRIIVDHGAKPDIAKGQWQDWRSGLQALAHEHRVFCKLSGLWTEAGVGAAAQTVAPYADQVLACFGPQRTLWGSDWPVLERAASYADWNRLALATVAPVDRDAVFGATARIVYGL